MSDGLQASSFQDYKSLFKTNRKVRRAAIAGLVLGLSIIIVLLVSLDSSVLCSPRAYSSGRWVWGPKTNITEMTNKEQSILFSGFESCASDRLKWWNLAADHPERFFRFPKAHSYKWETSSKCVGLEPLDPVALLKHLVEVGGWYLVGDSVTQNHFFSLSCILGPHVVESTYDPNPIFPHHLYLNPASPLMSALTLPIGFNISSTPLVTVRRADLLFSRQELDAIWQSTQQPHDNTTIFSQEISYTISMDTYLKEFMEPLPKAFYSTLIASSGVHWSPQYYFNGTKTNGISGILSLFKAATKCWADRFQEAVGREDQECIAAGEPCNHPRRRRAIIRDNVEGHDNCFTEFDPWPRIRKPTSGQMNWADLPRFNAMWKELQCIWARCSTLTSTIYPSPGQHSCVQMLTVTGIAFILWSVVV